MPTQYIQRLVNLEQSDYQVVRRLAQEKGFGGKGFSAALRLIIREWQAVYQPPPPPPTLLLPLKSKLLNLKSKIQNLKSSI